MYEGQRQDRRYIGRGGWIFSTKHKKGEKKIENETHLVIRKHKKKICIKVSCVFLINLRHKMEET